MTCLLILSNPNVISFIIVESLGQERGEAGGSGGGVEKTGLIIKTCGFRPGIYWGFPVIDC